MKKEILKEIREPGKSRKKKGQPKGRRNGFLEGLTGKDFTAAGLFFFSLLLCRLFVLQYGVFGSSIDWISQHSTLADYFRKRFYATGNLFPDFAWNLGGGQNIYHFAYYGLLSPTVLLSYLFPFIPMDLWVMGSSALLYAADAVLFYRWISKKGLHYGNCLFTSLFFTCSTALLYHSYNQLMFVNYMPFLLLALLGVDRHFQKRKSGLLILSVFGMILTSFYFSVGGHHITRPDYDMSLLEKCITGAQAKYGVQVYLEPGEAWALNAGYLVTTVLDTLQNGDTSLAILDLSAACHTPDVIEMPYRPPLLDAGEPGEKPCTVRLGGPTCLAGDVIGDYSFAAPLTEGQRLIFGDMAIYSTCKNNTFNGMPLPDIWQLCADGTLRRLAHFGYGDFKYRLGSRGGSAQPTTSVQI